MKTNDNFFKLCYHLLVIFRLNSFTCLLHLIFFVFYILPFGDLFLFVGPFLQVIISEMVSRSEMFECLHIQKCLYLFICFIFGHTVKHGGF